MRVNRRKIGHEFQFKHGILITNIDLTGISILHTRPKKTRPWIFSFLNPLSLTVWMSIIAAYFVVSFTLFLLSQISSGRALSIGQKSSRICKVKSRSSTEPDPRENQTQGSLNLRTSLWFVLASMLQQGIDTLPR